MSRARELWAVLAALGLQGCAHYYFPANHLETPETRGSGSGRLEWINFETASDLNAFAKTGEQGKPEVQSAFPTYAFGFSMPVSSRDEVGIRIQAYTPLLLRYKHQFAGAAESESKQGNWSASAALSAGLLMGQGSEPGAEGVTYGLVDLALPFGYRAWEKHLFSLTPFLSLARFSGMPLQALYTKPVPAAQLSSSTSITQYGAGLGYQYSIQSLFVRTELAYVKGSLGDSEIGGLFLAVGTGLNL